MNCSSVDQNIGCFCSLPSSCPPLFLSLFKLILDVCRFCCLRCCLVFTLVLSSMHLPIPFQKRHQENGGWREKQQSLEKKKRRRVVSASHFDPYVSLTPEFFSPKVREKSCHAPDEMHGKVDDDDDGIFSRKTFVFFISSTL